MPLPSLSFIHDGDLPRQGGLRKPSFPYGLAWTRGAEEATLSGRLRCQRRTRGGRLAGCEETEGDKRHDELRGVITWEKAHTISTKMDEMKKRETNRCEAKFGSGLGV